MRFRLSLESDREVVLPHNYQYALSAVVYRFIAAASETHAGWLHQKGFGIGHKAFKHFTFSKLLASPKPWTDRTGIYFPKRLTWYVSFAFPATMENFVIGLFEHQQFWLIRPETILRVLTVETLPDPPFVTDMRFTCLSPIFLKKPHIKDGRMRAEHLLPDHPEFSQILRKNLLDKLVSLNGTPAPDESETDFEFTPDRAYIRKRGGMDRISKLITIKEGEAAESRNRAFECPFSLHAHPDLIRTAYTSGLGNDNAMGFGMIETVNSRQ